MAAVMHGSAAAPMSADEKRVIFASSLGTVFSGTTSTCSA